MPLQILDETLEPSGPTLRRSTRKRHLAPHAGFVSIQGMRFGRDGYFMLRDDSRDSSADSEEDGLDGDDEIPGDIADDEVPVNGASAEDTSARHDSTYGDHSDDVIQSGCSKSDSATRTPNLCKECRTRPEYIDDRHDQTGSEHLPMQVYKPPLSPAVAQHEPHGGMTYQPRGLMVKVIFNTLAEERIIVVATQDALLQSKLYSKLLSHVKFGGYQMPCIQDPNSYSEAAILQAAEFFAQNTCPSLSLHNGSPSLLQQLRDKIDLYDFSIVAGIPKLEGAMVEQVTGCPDLTLDVFLSFSRLCYSRDLGHKVLRKSSMGQALKRWLKHFLPDIMSSNRISHEIQQHGGDVAAELEDVLGEHWAEVKKQRGSG